MGYYSPAKETKMYGAINRQEQHDLGLSPRDESRLQTEFASEFRQLCSNQDMSNGIWREVGNAARDRARLGVAPPNVLTIPTAARIWRPSRLDMHAVLKRDMTVGTDSAGGYLRATDNINFIEMLRNRMVAFQMGATRLSGLVGNVTIPKQTAGATAYWLSTEATAITEGNQTFGQLALTPKTVGAYTEVSRLLQLQSSPDIDMLVMNDLAQQVAIAADKAVLNGTGGEQPTGIIGTAGIGGFTGTTLALAALLDAQADVAGNNALSKTCGYVTTPTVAALLMARQRFTSTDSPLWEGNLNDGKVLGFKAMSSANIPTGDMIFGDFAQVVVGEWGVLELAINPAANFPAAITGIRATYTMDVGVRYAGAFSVATSIT